MRVVCTTATARIERQELSKLTDSFYVHTSGKRLRRQRKSTAFRHVQWSMPGSNVVFLIYANGRVVILGCVSTQQLDEAVNWLSLQLGSVVLQQPSISNVVTCMELGELPQLHVLAQSLRVRGHDVSFEPELSPGVVLRSKHPKSTAMLFRSGKAMVTGVNDLSIVDDVANAIRDAVSACLAT